MVAPFVPSSSTVINDRILEVRAHHSKKYWLSRFVKEQKTLLHILTAVFVVLVFIPATPPWLAIAFLVCAAVIQSAVWFVGPYVERWMREIEFRVVIELNQKFMKMFGLIGEGILTKEEFRSKAADLVGVEQVSRFFERRMLENLHRTGDLTNDELVQRMTAIGYGPEEAMEEWQFEMWMLTVRDI